jgi:hypothetical protein
MQGAGQIGRTLLDVLHLLAHLLDERLQVDRGARGLDVLRFGGQSIEGTEFTYRLMKAFSAKGAP